MPIYVDNKPISAFNFSGGESQVRLDLDWVSDRNQIQAYLYQADDIMRLLLTVDAIRRVNNQAKIDLWIPYFPYARQDRVCYPGEALSVAVMAQLINQLHCDTVTIIDPHSDVTPGLLNNCLVKTQADIILNSQLTDFIRDEGLTLVAPDQGAKHKTQDVANRLSQNATPVKAIFATKVRDTNTGQIISTKISDDVSGQNLIILDDICDGGRTFIELAKCLKQHGANDIYLFVTHGIFANGLDVLAPYFKKIFAYHLINHELNEQPTLLTLLHKEHHYEC